MSPRGIRVEVEWTERRLGPLETVLTPRPLIGVVGRVRSRREFSQR